jgi:hypothetical protein
VTGGKRISDFRCRISVGAHLDFEVARRRELRKVTDVGASQRENRMLRMAARYSGGAAGKITMSELPAQAQPQPQLPLVGQRAGNYQEIRRADVRIRAVEMRRVHRIRRLYAEFQVEPLGDRELTEKPQI